MEGRMRKYGGQASPSPPPALKQPQQQGRKIPVVYYLCRNRHLEHPHFIEVPLSSPEGLYLRDVINRLNVLRGKGMPAMYSWSCKRSYKNGFVWHDLSEDDLILPATGNEFVLKGSELLDQSPSDKQHHIGANGKLQKPKLTQSETSTSSRTNGTSSSSSPTTFKESKTPSPPSPSPPPPSPPPRLEQERCLLAHRLGYPGNLSPKAVSSSLAEYTVYKPKGASDASTQTDDGEGKAKGGRKNTCTRGISTDDGSMDFEYNQSRSNQATRSREDSELRRDEISPPPTSSSASSSGGKMVTLESLIRADASRMNNFRILEEEEILVPTGSRLKATNVLMQLITCGSISVKDHHSFGLVPTYKPRFSHMKFPSPIFSRSMILGELEYLSENPKCVGVRVEDKEYFSGSLIETKKHKEDMRESLPALKKSSSYNADRSSKSPPSRREKERFLDSSRSKCIPRPVRHTTNKQSRNEIMRSPISDCPRNSSAFQGCNQSSSIGGSKRVADVSSVEGSSVRQDSFKDGEKTIKIEERLISGARVIIQSRATSDDSEDSTSS